MPSAKCSHAKFYLLHFCPGGWRKKWRVLHWIRNKRLLLRENYKRQCCTTALSAIVIKYQSRAGINI